MSGTEPSAVSKWLSHIRALAEEIGPRGSTMEGERRGSEYCRSIFERLGYLPVVEHFSSARSIFLPHLIASLSMLLAYAIYPLAGRLSAALAALLSLVMLVSDLLELGFHQNLLRWLMPKGQSQNVYATVPPSGEHRRDLVLVGHVDSQRTPLIFRSYRWVSVYKAFTTAVFILFVIQVVLFLLGAVTQWSWIWFAAFPSAVGAVLLAAICLEADHTPFTAGANDNASGAGLVLALAEHLGNAPLQNTRVWMVCTGCEEVQHYGAIDFFHRHKDEFTLPSAIAFELMGCAGPGWLVKEGIIVPFYSDRKLVALAEQVAAANPDLGAYPVSINGGNTEMTDALQVGIPAITLFGMTPDGISPYWHQVGDTYDKLDPVVMDKTYAYTLAYIRALDQGV